MTLDDLIDQLQDLRSRYPEYAQAKVEAQEENGQCFKVTAVEVAAGPWIIVEETP